MNMSNFKKDFKAENSIIKFIGFTILTAGFYWMYWFIRMLEVAEEKYSVAQEETKTLPKLIWAIVFLGYFVLGLFEVLGFVILANSGLRAYEDFSVLVGITNLILIVLTIIFAIRTRDFALKLFTQVGFNRNVSLPLTIFFNIAYLYYVFNTIDKDNSIQTQKHNSKNSLEELEKLNELKEKGIITEEEFNLKKKQILG